jgi:hypothetical protein
MPAGRPKGSSPLYKPEYCELIVEFFNVPHTIPNPRKPKGEMIANDLPTFAMFAMKINRDPATVLGWTDQFEEFAKSYKKAKALQENMLMNNLLKGLYNPAGAIFTAKNVLGWRDRQELTGDKENPVGVTLYIPKEDAPTWK